MMKYNPEIHQRHSIRLKEYDYSNAGAYFVTMCTWQRECLFGDVTDGKMRLNEFGDIVGKEWVQTSIVRSNVELDGYIVMPNHFHGIILLNEPVGATRRVAPTTLQSGSIGAILGQFKSIAAKRVNTIRNTPGVPLWQRNYFERVIRNEKELHVIREYIINNPLQWDIDENNPVNL